MKIIARLLKKNYLYQYLLIISAIFALAAVVYAASVPHTFTAGTVAKSSEVNGNFDYLEDRSWDLYGDNIYYSKGNVGIGTSSPRAKLQIGDDIGGGYRNWMNNGIIVCSDNDGGYFGVKDEGTYRKDTVIAWGDDDDDNLRFIFNLSTGPDNGNEIMRLTATGNVGIGTTEPRAKLEILDNSHDVYHKGIRVYGPNMLVDEREMISLGKDDSKNNAAEIAFYYDGNMSSSNRLSLGLYNSPETVNILGNGNVGIGTTSPMAKLNLEGGEFRLTSGSLALGAIFLSSDTDYDHGYVFAQGGVAGSGRAIRFVDYAGYEYVKDVMVLNTDSGNVGIGMTSPNYTLHVNGTAGKPGGGSWSDSSDVRLKKEVKPLTEALDKLIQLQGVTFQWINPKEHDNQSGTQAGLIAQEVEKVFPEWVSETDPTGKDKEQVAEGEKVKTLQFPHGFNAYLIEAIKELKAENAALKARVEALERR